MSYTEQLREMELRRKQFELNVLSHNLRYHINSIIFFIVLWLLFSILGTYGFNNKAYFICVMGFSVAGSLGAITFMELTEKLLPAIKRKKLFEKEMDNWSKLWLEASTK
jgi:hypothetical protein